MVKEDLLNLFLLKVDQYGDKHITEMKTYNNMKKQEYTEPKSDS